MVMLMFMGTLAGMMGATLTGAVFLLMVIRAAAQAITLREGIMWLIGPGAGVLAFFIIEHWAILASLAPEIKRYVSWAITGGLAILAYCAGIGMLYFPMPADWRSWVETLFLVAASAIAVASVLHGRIVLSKKGSRCCGKRGL